MSSEGSAFPKRRRILRSTDFRRVYQAGVRIPGPYFTAFCLKNTEEDGPRVGFTVPRALGKAVIRNRIKRRVRESVRLRLSRLGREWAIVLNPRRSVLSASFEKLLAEVEKVFDRCGE